MGCGASADVMTCAPTQPHVMSCEGKLERLKSIDLFVLDNSIRETTVAQIRGHTLGDKYKIMDQVVFAGIKHQLIGSFGKYPRVDDVFVKELLGSEEMKKKYTGQSYFTFSEMFDDVVAGVPSPALPLGLERMQQYGVPNVVLEVSLACTRTNWNIWSNEKLLQLVDDRIRWIRNNCGDNPLILINIRDFVTAWAHHATRTEMLVAHISKYPTESQIFGLLFEVR